MAFWNKKKKKEENQQPPIKILSPCERGIHRYKDFDWYIETVVEEHHYTYRYIVKVVEPYVCIHCGHREDQVLGEWYFPKKQDAKSMIETLHEDPHIKSVIEVEDAIHDMQLVDREYLAIMHQLHPDKKILDEAKPD